MRPRRFGAVTAAVLALSACSPAPGVVGLPPKSSGAIDRAHAERVVARIQDDLAGLPTTTGAAADAQRALVFSGVALAAADARARVGTKASGSELDNPFSATGTRLALLAASSGTGYPRSLLLLAQGGATELPVLHLAQQKDVAAPYLVDASVRLLSGVTVNGFVDPSTGSAFTAPSNLVIAPESLGTAYARSLTFPGPAPLPPTVAADVYRSSVTKNAAAQAKSLSTQAGYAERYVPVKDSTRVVTQADGGALVLTALDRTTTLTVKPHHQVQTPPAFQTLDKGQKALTKQGVVSTLVLLAFQVPAGDGKAHLVGASEVVRSAEGS